MELVAHAVLPAILFIVFIVWTVAVQPGSRPLSSWRVRLLIAYVVVLTTIAGVSGRDLWPFAAWRFAAYNISRTGQLQSIVTVDSSGRETPLDSRVWEPLETTEFLRLPPAVAPGVTQAQLHFLLTRAQAAVARAKNGQPIGTFARFLGPLTAPVFQSTSDAWTDASSLPVDVVDVRIYLLHWRVENGVATIERRELLASTRP